MSDFLQGRSNFSATLLNANHYASILEESLFESAAKVGLAETLAFQYDNDPKHTATITKNFLQERRLTVLD